MVLPTTVFGASTSATISKKYTTLEKEAFEKSLISRDFSSGIKVSVVPETDVCNYRHCEHKLKFINDGSSEFCFDSRDIHIDFSVRTDYSITYTAEEQILQTCNSCSDKTCKDYKEFMCIMNKTVVKRISDGEHICINPHSSKEMVLSYIPPENSEGKWDFNMDIGAITWVIDPYWISENSTFAGTHHNTFLNQSGFIQINKSGGGAFGYYESQIFDAGSTVTWNNITLDYGGYYGFANPNNRAVEPKRGGLNMSQNVLLYHLDESSGAIVDSSGVFGNGVYTGVNYSKPGIFDKSLGFNGSGEYIDTGLFKTDILALGGGSISFWAKWDSFATYQSPGIASAPFSIWNDEFTLGMDALNQPKFTIFKGGYHQLASNYSINLGQWYHIVVKWGAAAGGQFIYVNGNLTASNADTAEPNAGVSASDHFYIGRILLPTYFMKAFNGNIDEFTIFNNSLTDKEVLDLYRRGINRLNVTVRSCDDVSCSGDTWNKTFSYQNQTWELSVGDSRYFQYNASLYTIDSAVSPQLYDVIVGYYLHLPPYFIDFAVNQTDTVSGSPLLVSSKIQNLTKTLDKWWFTYNGTLGNISTAYNGTNLLLWPTIGLFGNYSVFGYVNDTEDNSNKSVEKWVNFYTTTTLSPPPYKPIQPATVFYNDSFTDIFMVVNATDASFIEYFPSIFPRTDAIVYFTNYTTSHFNLNYTYNIAVNTSGNWEWAQNNTIGYLARSTNMSGEDVIAQNLTITNKIYLGDSSHYLHLSGNSLMWWNSTSDNLVSL